LTGRRDLPYACNSWGNAGARRMSDEEDKAHLAAYRAALSGERRRTRGGLTMRLIAAASVVGVGAAAAVGVMFFTASDRASLADPTGYRDPFLCEKALLSKFEDEADAIANGDAKPPPPGSPKVLYLCSPQATAILKTTAAGAERQELLANAIYALEIDGRTTVSGLTQPGMRYGWEGKMCEALKPLPAGGRLVLKGEPVDPKSC
jgi:hypothetical protein